MVSKRNGNLNKKCCDCGIDIEVKYNRARHNGSSINNGEYGTQNEKNKGKYKCKFCLYDLYKNNPQLFSELLAREKKDVFYNYVRAGGISERSNEKSKKNSKKLTGKVKQNKN